MERPSKGVASFVQLRQLLQTAWRQAPSAWTERELKGVPFRINGSVVIGVENQIKTRDNRTRSCYNLG
jgi:hypothetical protein